MFLLEQGAPTDILLKAVAYREGETPYGYYFLSPTTNQTVDYNNTYVSVSWLTLKARQLKRCPSAPFVIGEDGSTINSSANRLLRHMGST